MAAAHAVPVPASEAQSKLVAQCRAGCRSEKGKAGGLTLVGFDAAKARQERGSCREDDPQTARRHDAAARGAASRTPLRLAACVDTLGNEDRFRRRAESEPRLASVPAAEPRRILASRARFAWACKLTLNSFLPPDTISSGFDNIADVQNFSPTLMEGYLRAASQISRLAVGDRGASATSVTYKIGRTLSQMRHVDGTPDRQRAAAFR